MTVQWWSRIKSQPVVRTALKIVLVVFILCVAFVAAFLVVKKIESSSSSKTQITSAFVEQRVNEIAEIATLHHHYKKVANYQDAKKLLNYMPDWRINKSIKELSLEYQGDVKVGYALKDVKINVDSATRMILVELPEPKILCHSIDFESIRVLWETSGWFNGIKFEDFKKFFVAEQKKYETENGIELKLLAHKHAEKMIKLYLGSVVKLVEPTEKKSFIDRWIRPEDGYQIKMK